MRKKVYLVGAGPGDWKLLTLQAVELLESADVVLYDALVNPEILRFCQKSALRIHVGKRRENHTKKQEEINRLLVEYAQRYACVVRLKGGTPFVFGRGYEEVRAIREGGFEPVIVSGVSATTGVPESFMLPLVDRAFNDAYRTISGHDVARFAEIIDAFHERETLEIMMGVYHLKALVEVLLAKGFPGDLPLAILSRGTQADACKIVSTLQTVVQSEPPFFEHLTTLTPAIILVGRVVGVMQEGWPGQGGDATPFAPEPQSALE